VDASLVREEPNALVGGDGVGPSVAVAAGEDVVRVGVGDGSRSRAEGLVWGLDLPETVGGAGGVGGLLRVRVATGAAPGTHFVSYDGNGNVWNLVSASTGTETARYEYVPFGEPLRLSGPAARSNPFRFSTKRTEDFTGLVLYKYRMYHVRIGRWLTTDLVNEPGFASSSATRLPLRLEEERNLVAFVGNDPMQQVDGVGTSPCICVFKGNIGRLTVKGSCRGVLSMWVIDEYAAPAAGATAGVTVSADGFVIGGDTYKIDGSTCVEIDCNGSTVTITCCVNLIARCLGKRCPYVVSPGSFGGPPKEPPPGSPPPVVK